MTEKGIKEDMKVPEPTLRRLPWYLAYLKILRDRGITHASSTQIARETGVECTQVAKDLSYIHVQGKTRVGYIIITLVEELEKFLGFTTQHDAVIFGVGSLGAALLHDSGLGQYGLRIVAGFDVKEALWNTTINHIPVYDIAQFKEINRKLGVTIGIITVPVESAQAVADQIIADGIQALWNFTPFRIRVPQDIVVQNISIYSHLAVMFNRLESINNNSTL